MHPICQRLRNQRQFPAATTHLSRIVRRNCDHGDTSFFRFVRQDRQERSPRDIKCGFRKPTTGDTPNVQIFVNNRTVARNQGTRRLVVEIPPQIADPLMLLLQHTNGFPATVAALLSASNTPLRQPQRGLLLPIVPWRRNALIVRCDQEGFQSEVDPNRRARGRRNVYVAQIAREHHVPVTGLAGECDGLNPPLDRPMQLDLHSSNVLKVDLAPVEAAAIAIGRKFNRIKAITTFEPGMSRRLARLDAPEEGNKRLVQTPQGGLTARKVRCGEEGVGRACGLQMSRLFAIGHAALLLCPRLFAFRKRIVVEPPVSFEHGAHRRLLLARGIQLVFECLPHDSASLLLLDVLLDDVRRDVTGTANVVASTP